ncbi:RND family efflux transporter MFP subunit [Desulfobaculum xiamenense]|uniref:RND family efflux transporter MFP subunit n=1 Tax=Desulfobaculum xiamenense TaxID=995050 RepID=A0A846QJK0_9BACT|nr:efflux RND transporter periplasmic adaptor subunit [Desulfobaculum xiamenense]NJB68321.1 RND family efflux transporter MFP subunit [Desulfobaculum xiamenense]
MSIALRSAALVAALVLAMPICACRDDIPPGSSPRSTASDAPSANATAHLRTIPEIYEAVGTVRPRTETRIDAQVTGTILRVEASAGDSVSRGDVLAVLDDREYAAREEQSRQALASANAAREQARQGINEARAAFTRAEAQYRRSRQLFDEKAISSRELEIAEAEYLQTEARLGQSRDGLRAAEANVQSAAKRLEEARISQGYTIVRAPEDAEVARRLAEPGDLAVPGKPLFILQSAGRAPGALRLEAHVREGLVADVRPGRELHVVISAVDAELTGTVEEVVPTADPRTRTFLVKVGLPATPGVYPGMFGRLLIPSGSRHAVLIPPEAVVRVGQLESVRVLDGDAWRSVYVKTGALYDGMIEALSGLSDGDVVALPGGGNVR